MWSTHFDPERRLKKRGEGQKENIQEKGLSLIKGHFDNYYYWIKGTDMWSTHLVFERRLKKRGEGQKCKKWKY